MSLRTILLHPDPRLRKPAEAVADVDDAVRALIEDMFETMYDAPGIGLAAPQIGVSRRVLVMDCAKRASEEETAPGADGDLAALASPEPVSDAIAMINPEITWSSEERRIYNEGCLSVPEFYEDVERPSAVRVRYLDAAGATVERAFDGLAATCVQHEIDHLNGKLFIDYLGPVKRAMITTKMKKVKRERAKERAAEPSRA